MDANGGAGGPIATKLLKALGVEAILIGEKAEGNFTHEPEPIATNLSNIGPMVKKAKVHAGFVLDPDADRLALFNENGEFLGEELTLAIAAWARLEEKPAPWLSICPPLWPAKTLRLDSTNLAIAVLWARPMWWIS